MSSRTNMPTARAQDDQISTPFFCRLQYAISGRTELYNQLWFVTEDGVFRLQTFEPAKSSIDQARPIVKIVPILFDHVQQDQPGVKLLRQ